MFGMTVAAGTGFLDRFCFLRFFGWGGITAHGAACAEHFVGTGVVAGGTADGRKMAPAVWAELNIA